ncbi:MAG: MG2 domain-containing protein [Pseudomonadota bacterium]
MTKISWFIFTFLLLQPFISSGASVKQFSPQGRIDQQTTITAQFSTKMVKLGDTAAPAPFVIHCGKVGGEGRWLDANTWAWRLDRPLQSGERCEFVLRSDLVTPNGEPLDGRKRFEIFAPGPWPRTIFPRPEATVAEDQAFIINVGGGLPTTASVEKSIWCEAEGVGNRIPVRLVPDSLRREILSHSNTHSGQTALVLSCTEKLPPGARMKLVWDKDVETANGIKSPKQESFIYTVRAPFRADMTCTRENAGAPCSPLSAVNLTFTGQTDIKLLQKARLLTPTGVCSPSDPNKDSDLQENVTSSLTFPGPWPPNAELTLELPADLKDDAGRPLANADRFPLKFRTGELPPLAKFPGTFGIVELQEGGLLPVTLRNVEAKLTTGDLHLSGRHTFADQRLNEDSDIIAAIQALTKFENRTQTVKIERDGEMGEYEDPWYAREFSFLNQHPDTAWQTLPLPGAGKEFEVVGIPLSGPGYHIVEIKSQLLGSALLSSPKPMYVRTAVLVTNLAVHLKQGKDNALVWVTALDTGKPVPDAEIRVSSCNGKEQWRGKTDSQGRAHIDQPLNSPYCEESSFIFASARLGDDFSFVRSDWNEGIEPWRFGVQTWSDQSDFSLHTVFDRTLFRPGQTVSMKHFARTRDSKGFAFPAVKDLPDRLTIRHTDGAEFSQPLTWDSQGSAVSTWKIPDSARRGTYEVTLFHGKHHVRTSGEFRVGDFRLPVFTGSLQGVPARQVAPEKVALALGLSFLNGGAAKEEAVKVSATLRRRWPSFPHFTDYNFDIPFDDETCSAFGIKGNRRQEFLVMDSQPLTLDKAGAGTLDVALPEKVEGPSELYAEMSFTDPVGETQTISGKVELWPASVVLGIQVDENDSNSENTVKVKVVALDNSGEPVTDRKVTLLGRRQIDYSHRRRIVGGFYAYEHHSEYVDLGEVCNGLTDSRGVFTCEPQSTAPGNIHFLAEAGDKAGNIARTGYSYWSSGNGDSWFTAGNQDRIDVIPDKRSYKPGETASLLVHTPFVEGTALISVEAAGIIDTFVQPLSRFNPTVKLPVKADWGPNVFVSVLVVRGRVQPPQWYSFFNLGWREPTTWFNNWWNPQQPTAMVDLAKPSYRLGLAEIGVEAEGFKLQVKVTTDKATYQPREQAMVQLKVTTPDGKAAPTGTEVAFAAVDQALLELRPNASWNLLESMLQKRAYEVETATAQSQVIGKRHFGKKALPAGGGGGRGPARELFDTLLTWNPRVKLDADGSATVHVPMNDSLTEFKMVGIASSGASLFGTGSTSVRTSQELQLVSGLPPMIREKDSFQGLLTLRNSTARAMSVTVTAKAGDKVLEPRQVKLAAEGATEVEWTATAPEDAQEMIWDFAAKEEGGKGAHDQLKITQQVMPAVPVTVRQATFTRIEGSYEAPVTLPAGALAGKGGLEIGLAAKLSTPPPGLKRFFEEYPFTCLEQKISIAVGLHDEKRWLAIVADLPNYLDSNDLVRYFPGQGAGSETLSAYLLDMAALSGFTLPEEVKDRLIKGLTAFVEGRSKPKHWSPFNDLPARKLMILEALTRQGQTPVRAAAALEVEPMRLSTASLIDWYLVVRRLPAMPQRPAELAAAEQELRNRLSYTGGRLSFTTEKSDYWWWLMISGDSNAFRLIEAMLDEPAWQEDLPRLMRGAIERQEHGRWFTTTANAWAAVVLARFGSKFEHTPVNGITRATLAQDSTQLQWEGADTAIAPLSLAWPPTADSNDQLVITHQGAGSPWATVQLLAAVPVEKPTAFGFKVSRKVVPIQEKTAGKVSRGDIWRVTVSVDSDQDMTWVVLSDPIPAGATILGDGNGRDSRIATLDENIRSHRLWPTFVERTFGFFRAYYELVPKGHLEIEYTVRINNSGTFSLPPTRVEAMYAPDVFGESPNLKVLVEDN